MGSAPDTGIVYKLPTVPGRQCAPNQWRGRTFGAADWLALSPPHVFYLIIHDVRGRSHLN